MFGWLTALMLVAARPAHAGPADPGPPPILPPDPFETIPEPEQPAPKQPAPQQPAPTQPKQPAPAPKQPAPTQPKPAPTQPAPKGPAPKRPAPTRPETQPPPVEAPVEAPEDDLAIPEPDGVAAPLEGSAPAETKPKSPAIPGERSPEQQAFEPEAPAEDAAEDKEAAEEEDEDSPAARKKRREKLRKNPKKWPHNGLVFELQVGTQGCFRRYCHGEANLNAGPGFRLFGFLGGNAYGILDFGISFGWGTLGAGDVTGKNAIGIYELDPNILQNIAVDTFGVDVFNVDLTRLNVQDVSLRTVDVGPALRIHFLRRGRFDPFVGVGIHYMLWRGRYETDVGKARLDFHGVGVPFEIGMNVFVHPNIAVGANFSYLHTHYFLASFQHPDANGLAPLALLDPAVVSTEEDTTFHDGLPRFWTLTFGARTRF